MTILFTDTLIQVSAFLFDVHGGIDMDAKFVRDRITELRMLNNVSEYKLSLDLGRSHSYIQSISSGKTSPSMSVFFDICNYFDISPSEFFDKDIHNPNHIHRIVDKLKMLSDDDLDFFEETLRRYLDKK